MPTYSNITQDVQWVVSLAVGGLTQYQTLPAAIAAAVTLSAGNSNAPVYILDALQLSTSPANGIPRTEMVGEGQLFGGVPGGDSQLWAVQLVSGTTYYPLETARVAAYALSTSNAGAPVLIYRPYFSLTAP
jgi:hypothetical protein